MFSFKSSLPTVAALLALLSSSSVVNALFPACGVCGDGKTQCDPTSKTLHPFSTTTATLRDNIQQTVWSYQGAKAGEMVKVTRLHKANDAYTALEVTKPSTGGAPYVLAVYANNDPFERLSVPASCVRTYKGKSFDHVDLELP